MTHAQSYRLWGLKEHLMWLETKRDLTPFARRKHLGEISAEIRLLRQVVTDLKNSGVCFPWWVSAKHTQAVIVNEYKHQENPYLDDQVDAFRFMYLI